MPVGPFRCQDTDLDHAVGEVGIAAAIMAVLGCAAPLDRLGFRDGARLDKSADDVVTFGVDIGPDVVGDLAGIMAKADATVEGRVAKPKRPPVIGLLRRQPEPDVMAAVGAVATGCSKARSCRRPS